MLVVVCRNVTYVTCWLAERQRWDNTWKGTGVKEECKCSDFPLGGAQLQSKWISIQTSFSRITLCYPLQGWSGASVVDLCPVLLIDLVPAVGCHRPGVWYFVGYVIRSAMWKLGGLGGSWFRSGWDVAHILDTRCRPHMAHIPWPNMGHVPNFAVMKPSIKAWTLFQNLSYPRFSLAAV